jgi:hypothetical protein
MREMEMYYADVQKESIDKGVDVMFLEEAKSSPCYIQQYKCVYAIKTKTKRPVTTHGHSTSKNNSITGHHTNTLKSKRKKIHDEEPKDKWLGGELSWWLLVLRQDHTATTTNARERDTHEHTGTRVFLRRA